MSYTEFHFGRMKEVTLPDNQTIEDFCKEKSKADKLASYNKTWLEQYQDENYEYKPGSFFIRGNKVYEILEHHEDDDNDYYMKLIKGKDDVITFIGSFYNGGTCFTEMLEDELDKYQK